MQGRICICNERFSAGIPTDLSLRWKPIPLAARFCFSNWNLISVMRDFLLAFPQICLCNGNYFLWQHDSVSVIGFFYFPQKKVSVCNQLDTMAKRLCYCLLSLMMDCEGKSLGSSPVDHVPDHEDLLEIFVKVPLYYLLASP